MYEREISGISRTTNGLECYHSTLNKLFLKSYPDIGLFGKQLQKEHLRNKKKSLCALFLNMRSFQFGNLLIKKRKFFKRYCAKI
jgi:hypothetical protein